MRDNALFSVQTNKQKKNKYLKGIQKRTEQIKPNQKTHTEQTTFCSPLSKSSFLTNHHESGDFWAVYCKEEEERCPLFFLRTKESKKPVGPQSGGNKASREKEHTQKALPEIAVLVLPPEGGEKKWQKKRGGKKPKYDIPTQQERNRKKIKNEADSDRTSSSSFFYIREVLSTPIPNHKRDTENSFT